MRTFPSKVARRLAAAALVIVGGANIASAGTSSVVFASTGANSVKHRASFSGTASFDNTTDLLTVTLTNTTASHKGYLTRFAFDIAGSQAAKYEDTDGRRGFNAVLPRHGLKLKPFGVYEEGVKLYGSAHHGIAAGSSRSFLFDVQGATLGEQAIDLLTNSKGLSIVADFKGLRHGKRDRVGVDLSLPVSTLVPGGVVTPTPIPIDIPPAGGGGKGVPAGGGGGVLPGGGGGNGGKGGGIVAVPLPSAGWSGLGMMGLLVAASLRRKGVMAAA